MIVPNPPGVIDIENPERYTIKLSENLNGILRSLIIKWYRTARIAKLRNVNGNIRR